jgi:multiple sugar transport system substrate-binding protein
MLKRTFTALIAASMLFATAGCGPKDPGTSSSASGTKSTDAGAAGANANKLVIWDKAEFNKDYNDMVKARVDQFGKDNNVPVEYVVIPPNDLKAKLLAAIEGKNPPDLVVTDDFSAKQFAGMDQLVDVSDISGKIEFTDAAKKMSMVKKGNFFIPQAFLAPGMYVRKDKWEAKGAKIPDTWQEVKDTAKLVNDPKGGFFALGFPMGASGGGDAEGMLRCMILGYGGAPVDKDNKITINSKETLEALKMAASFYKESLTPPAAVTWDDAGNNNAYLAGTAGLIMNSGSVMTAMKKDKPDLMANTVVVPFPAGPKGRFIPGGGNVFAIFKNGKNTEAAKKFVAAFYDKTFYQSLIEKMSGMWQPTVKGFEDTEFWKKPENKGWLESSKNIIPNTYPAESDELANKAFSEQLIVKAVQKIVVNNVDPQKALDELEAEFKRVYGQK